MHFSPRENWMNDPNGLIFHNGVFHLYFQYNPLGSSHANMSWGHATSKDLTTWVEQPIAILFDDDEEIFSGSIVFDADNRTGFGTADHPPLVACYTSHSKHREHQTQSLAFSLDDGVTWETYSGNPVLDRDSANFRDPKVFRWTGADESYWVMVAVEAAEHQVVLYRSDDLINWEYLSSFGPAGAIGGVWECPDLFPLHIDGAAEQRWVLLVSLFPGGIGGGSGTQYFVGNFDGQTFTSDVTPAAVVDVADAQGVQWLDFGRDCYAGVTFAGLPDNERTLIAWMDNWAYAKDMPARKGGTQRGAMTLPRRLSLTQNGERIELAQSPVTSTMTEVHRVENQAISDACTLPIPPTGHLELEVDLDDAGELWLRLDGDERQFVEISYRASTGLLTLERHTLESDVPEAFFGTQQMSLSPSSTLQLSLWIDEGSVEVCADQGSRVLTSLTAGMTAQRVSLRAAEGTALLRELRISVPASA